jgi:hypothetical protein
MVLETIALGLLLAWIPVFLHFVGNWKRRWNPESLAIVTLILFAAYVATVPAWLRMGIATNAVLAVMLVLDAAVCGHFYLAFRWAKRRFVSDRRQGSK